MKSARARPPLAGPLSVILPDPEDTLILRACLSERALAAAAWRTGPNVKGPKPTGRFGT